MITYLTLDDVLALHRYVIAHYGGNPEIHDLGMVESAVAQPRMTFGGEDLYPTLPDKAAALGFSLASNHGFKDGNKRIGFLAADVFLRANGHKLAATTEDAEPICLGVASHTVSRQQFTEWVRQHTVTL